MKLLALSLLTTAISLSALCYDIPEEMNKRGTIVCSPAQLPKDRPQCTKIRSTREIYKGWITNNPNLTFDNLNVSTLSPPLTEKEKEVYATVAILYNLKKLDSATFDPCFNKFYENEIHQLSAVPECSSFEKEIIESKIRLLSSDESLKNLSQDIFRYGKEYHKQDPAFAITEMPPKIDVPVKRDLIKTTTTTDVVTIKETPKKETSIPLVPIVDDDAELKTTVNPGELKEAKVEERCKQKLSFEIAKILESDKKIISIQFEITVLKMTSEVLGAHSIEGLIQKRSKYLTAIDKGVTDKINSLYQTYGLKEDVTSIAKILKEKAESPTSFDKHKLFFNQDSSAFLLAHKKINPASKLNDADISVLWFMEKVYEGTKNQTDAFSSRPPHTNLSLRIAQYTREFSGKQASQHSKFDEIQRQNIDKEFLGVVKVFKINNPTCFKNLNEQQEASQKLLPVNLKISEGDLLNIEGKLQRSAINTRFSISQYVD